MSHHFKMFLWSKPKIATFGKLKRWWMTRIPSSITFHIFSRIEPRPWGQRIRSCCKGHSFQCRRTLSIKSMLEISNSWQMRWKHQRTKLFFINCNIFWTISYYCRWRKKISLTRPNSYGKDTHRSFLLMLEEYTTGWIPILLKKLVFWLKFIWTFKKSKFKGAIFCFD